MDRLTREHRNVLLIATTNFPKALDKAVLSRADYIEEIGLPGSGLHCKVAHYRLPNEAARRKIISDTPESHRQRMEDLVHCTFSSDCGPNSALLLHAWTAASR
jgi:AAA+ superfamily predicted ATPase